MCSMRKYLVLLLVAGLALASSTADVSPYISSEARVNPGEGDLPVLDSFDIEGLGASQYCLGVGYDGTNFWVTDGQDYGGLGTNQIHIISNEAGSHSLVTSVDQNGTSSWGLRDLTSDGDYMFASQSTTVDYYDISTYEKVGSYSCSAVNPNRAQAWDGNYFYTGSFSETIYQVEWDGVSGSTASYTTWSTAVANGGTYGAAYDPWNDCLWVSTASSDGMLYQIGMDGALIDSYNLMPEQDTSGGACMAPYEGQDQLWVLAQDDPDMVYCWEVNPESLSPATWGEIKTLF